MLRRLLNSTKRAWRGAEKLWIVFWGWLILFQLSDWVLHHFLPFYPPGHFLATLALKCLYVIAYSIFIFTSLWRCARNTKLKLWFYLTRLFVLVVAAIMLYRMVELFTHVALHTLPPSPLKDVAKTQITELTA